MDYFIRVTKSFTAVEPLFNQLEAHCEAYAVYEHDSDKENVHIHFYLKKCKRATDTLKLWIEKILGKRPTATEWSFKSKDVDESCISYMSKGKLKPMKFFGISTERIEELTLQGYDVKDNVKLSKPKGQVTQFDMIEEVYDDVIKKLPYKEQNVLEKWIADKVDPECDDAQLYQLIITSAISIHRKHRKGFCDFSLKKIVQPVYCRFNMGHKSFVNKMMDNYFSSYKT
jgi:hypothetical protein